MPYVRDKNINGHTYYYLVESKRDGRKVRQIHLQYLGKHPEGAGYRDANPNAYHDPVPEGAEPEVVVGEDRLGAPGEGGTRSLYAYYYEMAPSYGIFNKKDKEAFARRMTRTASGEIRQSKKNVRQWVRASKAALASKDKYRIAETARQSPGNIAGEVRNVPEIQLVYEHLGQANIAGQHMESAFHNEKLRKEHEDEFRSIVNMIDSETSDWENA